MNKLIAKAKLGLLDTKDKHFINNFLGMTVAQFNCLFGA